MYPYGSTTQAEDSQDSPLARIPNTPEVEAFKEAFYAEALREARRAGYGSQAKQMLERLGLTGPPAATVEATITLPVRVSVETLFGEGTTAEQARERLAGYSTAQLAREGQRYANYDEATVQFNVENPTNS